jgi:hypothetical protein
MTAMTIPGTMKPRDITTVIITMAIITRPPDSTAPSRSALRSTASSSSAR